MVFHQPAQEGMAEKLGKFSAPAGRGEMEETVFIKHPAGGQHMEMGMKNQVVAKSVQGGDGSDFAGGDAGALPQPECERFSRGGAKELEVLAVAPENPAQRPWHGKDDVAVGQRPANFGGDELGCFD
jgi:hypothetical protein